MKTYLKASLLILFLLLRTTVFAQFTGDTYKKAQETKRASVVLTYPNAPGFSAKNANGQVEGLCVDIMNGFAQYVKQKKGIELSFRYEHGDANNFSSFIQHVQVSEGGVFGLGNVTITQARKEHYTFSPAFINNISILMSNIEMHTLRTISDIQTGFAQKTCYMVEHTTNEARILEIRDRYSPNMKIVPVSSDLEALEAVKKDPNGYTILDFTYYLEARKNGAPIKRHPAGDASAEEFGLIMPQSNDWAPLLKEYMKELLPSQEYRNLIVKHIGYNALQMLDAVAKKNTTTSCNCDCDSE
jgi:ABC-type amino acid transport substrate-binding protein